MPWTARARAVARVVVRACAIGAMVYVAVWWGRYVDMHLRKLAGSDLAQIWVGARELLAGRDPYASVGPRRFFPWPSHLAYPATAMVVAVPLARLSSVAADMVFVGVSFALLAFVLTRRHPAALIACFSWPAVLTVDSVQWAPIFTAAALVPWLGFLWAAKPTVGIAYFVYRPSRTSCISAIGGGLVLVLIATAMRPDWFGAWMAALAAPGDPAIVGVSGGLHRMYLAPIARPGGFLILAALLRWRRPEARLLVVLACVPQTMLGYELLPIVALVPATLAQYVSLTGWSWVMFWRYHLYVTPGMPWQAVFSYCGAQSVWFVFLPAVLLVLTRPNEGPVPRWIDRVSRA